MKPPTSLQTIVDPFVRRFGGEIISDLVGNDGPPSNADYLFRRHDVIAELKSLQDDTFGEPLRRKLGARMAEWHRRSGIVVYGTNRFESRDLTPECENEMFDIISAPLQSNVVKAANHQIESTKKILGIPNAKGLLWVASDGNSGLQPEHIWHLLKRILQKRREDGSPQYSHIHAVAYFSPRMLVQLRDSEQPGQVWLSGVRDNADEQLSAFLVEISEAWYNYVAWAQGVRINRVGGAVPPGEISFFGISPVLPKIHIGDSTGAKESDDKTRSIISSRKPTSPRPGS